MTRPAHIQPRTNDFLHKLAAVRINDYKVLFRDKNIGYGQTGDPVGVLFGEYPHLQHLVPRDLLQDVDDISDGHCAPLVFVVVPVLGAAMVAVLVTALAGGANWFSWTAKLNLITALSKAASLISMYDTESACFC